MYFIYYTPIKLILIIISHAFYRVEVEKGFFVVFVLFFVRLFLFVCFCFFPVKGQIANTLDFASHRHYSTLLL